MLDGGAEVWGWAPPQDSLGSRWRAVGGFGYAGSGEGGEGAG